MTDTDRQTLGHIVEAMTDPTVNQEAAEHLGKEMFRFYSEKGLPPDFFIDRLDLSLNAKIIVLFNYQTEMLEHRRRSGITQERIEKLRTSNRRTMTIFIETGEIGAY